LTYTVYCIVDPLAVGH